MASSNETTSPGAGKGTDDVIEANPPNRKQRRSAKNPAKQQDHQMKGAPGGPPMVPDTGTQEQPDGVFIVKKANPETGQLEFIPQTIGNIQVTEVTTIIEFGLRRARKDLGLD